MTEIVKDPPPEWPIHIRRTPLGLRRFRRGDSYEHGHPYIYFLWNEAQHSLQYIGLSRSLHRRWELQDKTHRDRVSVMVATKALSPTQAVAQDSSGKTWTHMYAVKAVNAGDANAAELAYKHLYRPVRQGNAHNAPVTREDQRRLALYQVSCETGWQEWPRW